MVAYFLTRLLMIALKKRTFCHQWYRTNRLKNGSIVETWLMANMLNKKTEKVQRMVDLRRTAMLVLEVKTVYTVTSKHWKCTDKWSVLYHHIVVWCIYSKGWCHMGELCTTVQVHLEIQFKESWGGVGMPSFPCSCFIFNLRTNVSSIAAKCR